MITVEANNQHIVDPFSNELDEHIAREYNAALIREYQQEAKTFNKQTLKYFLDVKSGSETENLFLHLTDWIAIMQTKSTEKYKGGYIINNEDNQIKIYYDEMILSCKDSIQQTETYIRLLEAKKTQKKPKSTKLPKEVIKTLADATVSVEAENAIYKILVDAELVDVESKIFKDKANGNVGHFYSTIILFFEKGYLKRKPTKDEYLSICLNTFKLKVSDSTAKNHKTRADGLPSIPSFS